MEFNSGFKGLKLSNLQFLNVPLNPGISFSKDYQETQQNTVCLSLDEHGSMKSYNSFSSHI